MAIERRSHKKIVSLFSPCRLPRFSYLVLVAINGFSACFLCFLAFFFRQYIVLFFFLGQLQLQYNCRQGDNESRSYSYRQEPVNQTSTTVLFPLTQLLGALNLYKSQSAFLPLTNTRSNPVLQYLKLPLFQTVFLSNLPQLRYPRPLATTPRLHSVFHYSTELPFLWLLILEQSLNALFHFNWTLLRALLILWLLLALALLTQAWLQYSIQSTNYLIQL